MVHCDTNLRDVTQAAGLGEPILLLFLFRLGSTVRLFRFCHRILVPVAACLGQIG